MVQVIVHGGVSGTPRPPPSLAGALEVAATTRNALDAAEAAVSWLEDHPDLNAGYGSVLSRSGSVELDAGIAVGGAGCGSVAAVSVRHPVSLARAVMETTPHAFMAGPGATELARSLGLSPLEDTTAEQRERWRRSRDAGALSPNRFGEPEQVDTVGAVALDDHGRLCAASSTGGVLGKLPGRVGDSAVLGAGFYASPAAAVVGTGLGELFIETLACFRTAQLIEDGVEVQTACERTLELLGRRSSAAAGLLALTPDGDMGAAFRGAAWVVEGATGAVEAVRLGPAE